MKKKLIDLTKEDICGTCEQYSNNFTGECPIICPFYMKDSWEYKLNNKRIETHCKTNFHYIKHHPNEKVEFDKRRKMTNREHLNTLDDMHYAIAVLAKVSELQLKNENPEADIWESVNDNQMDFEDWLAEEYKESEENEGIRN